MGAYSIFSILRNALNGQQGWQPAWRKAEPTEPSPNASTPVDPGAARAPLAVPAATGPKALSVVVVFYLMKREAARTMHSLSRRYQQGLDDASYDVEGQLLHRIGFSQPLLPAEPVGVGARWVYATDGHLRGEFVDLRMTYQLLEMTGTKLRLSMDQEVDRPAQTVRGRKGEGTRVEAERRRYRALMEVDLVKAPLPTVRFFDAEGREVEQIVVGWSDG